MVAFSCFSALLHVSWLALGLAIGDDASTLQGIRDGEIHIQAPRNSKDAHAFRVHESSSVLWTNSPLCSSHQLYACYVIASDTLPAECPRYTDDQGRPIRALNSLDLLSYRADSKDRSPSLGLASGWPVNDKQKQRENQARHLPHREIYWTIPSRLKRLARCISGELKFLPDEVQWLGYKQPDQHILGGSRSQMKDLVLVVLGEGLFGMRIGASSLLKGHLGPNEPGGPAELDAAGFAFYPNTDADVRASVLALFDEDVLRGTAHDDQLTQRAFQSYKLFLSPVLQQEGGGEVEDDQDDGDGHGKEYDDEDDEVSPSISAGSMSI
eukprot:CAMPEP_0119307032 /NCGR_PEP_ID=MMETSP1333-20130426/7642_1 /TAXON_ID=418940 /ORGANISM="Scyphosphaera apsteinii, Strain RCC1455" /LENGTH=324 /DNA_ID=CAMNT_0007310493 /DNA_START=131 /DNA_END=1105 /DNA_ORIENTATION=+